MGVISEKRLDKMIKYYENPSTQEIDWYEYNKTKAKLQRLFKDTHTALKNYKVLRSIGKHHEPN